MSEEKNMAPSAVECTVEGTKIAQKEITPAAGANNSDNEQLQEPVEKRQRLSPRNDNILHKVLIKLFMLGFTFPNNLIIYVRMSPRQILMKH